MKDFDTIHVKCRPGKEVLRLCIISGLSYILHLAISFQFGQYTQIDVWTVTLIKVGMIYWFLSTLIIILTIIKKKKNRYFIKIYDKIVIKNKKEYKYESVEYTQTFLQKIFGVITVYFYNYDSTEKIILKDVSKSILYYL